MQSRVQLYLDLAPGTTLQKVATPLLPEDQHEAPARAPASSGPVEECPVPPYLLSCTLSLDLRP